MSIKTRSRRAIEVERHLLTYGDSKMAKMSIPEQLLASLVKIAEDVTRNLSGSYTTHDTVRWRSYQYTGARTYRLYIHKNPINGYHVQVNRGNGFASVVGNAQYTHAGPITGPAPEFRMAVNLSGMSTDQIRALFRYTLTLNI
jgi:hypothetical protein